MATRTVGVCVLAFLLAAVASVAVLLATTASCQSYATLPATVRFEQRKFQQTGNGIRTHYDYDPLDRRLATLRFVYDDGGDRVIKRGAQGETVYVNDKWTVRNRSVGTKHVYVGTSRIASRLSPGDAHVRPREGDLVSLMLGRWWEHRSRNGHQSGRNVEKNPHCEYEHMQYFPSGEPWVDQRSNTERLPYLFSGKELDQETGLYYFGARYYDPRVGLWASADPASTEYLEGQLGFGGVFQPINLATYVYAAHNPQKYIDPDGRVVWLPVLAAGWAAFEIGSAIYDAYSAYQTFQDPDATTVDRTLAVGGVMLSVVAPGGGYGTAGKVGKEVVEEGAEQVFNRAVRELPLPSASATKKAAGSGSKGGVGPVTKGQEGVARSRAAAEARGERVLGEEVTMDADGVRVRLDLLVEKADGGLKGIDAKNGPAAGLTRNQRAGYPALEAKGGVPRGSNAAEAGLEPGKLVGTLEDFVSKIKIDLISQKPDETIVLVMIEDRPWDGSRSRMEELQARVNEYLTFALDGYLEKRFPAAKGKPVEFRLDCREEPDRETLEFIAKLGHRLKDFGVLLEVNVR